MISHRGTFFLGIFIFLIPFLGFPSSWKTFFVVLCGLILVLISIKINPPKKIIKSRPRKSKTIQDFPQNVSTESDEENSDIKVIPIRDADNSNGRA